MTSDRSTLLLFVVHHPWFRVFEGVLTQIQGSAPVSPVPPVQGYDDIDWTSFPQTSQVLDLISEIQRVRPGPTSTPPLLTKICGSQTNSSSATSETSSLSGHAGSRVSPSISRKRKSGYIYTKETTTTTQGFYSPLQYHHYPPEQMHMYPPQQHPSMVRSSHSSSPSRMEAGGSPGLTGRSGPIAKQKKGAGNLPAKGREMMKEWLMQNLHNPYPSTIMKERFIVEGGLLKKQVETWFKNARLRLKK